MINLLKRFAILGMLGLSACLNVAEIQDNPSDPTTETFATVTGVVISEMTKTAAGTFYKDSVVGTGDLLTTQDNVDIDYSAYLKNGFVFDVGSDVPIALNAKIFGLRDGMAGMRVGGIRKIVVPSALGYGPYPNGPVPPNSTLIFDIRLVALP